MKKIVIGILFCLVILSGCISTQEMSRIIENKIKKDTSGYIVASDWYSIKSDSLPKMDSIVRVKKIKSFFIPAILYWELEHTLKCEINPKIPVNYFTKKFIEIADSVDLKSKLKGKKIEISISEIPSSFIYTEKERAIILIVGYIVGGQEVIYSDYKNFKISYKVFENNQVAETGYLTIKNIDPSLKNTWASTNKFVSMYINQYRLNSGIMYKELIEKLLKELEN